MDMMTFLSRCRAPENLRWALVTAMIVGPVLTAINQSAAIAGLFSGQPLPAMAALRIGLTFAVPFIVSLTSAALAESRRSSSRQRS